MMQCGKVKQKQQRLAVGIEKMHPIRPPNQTPSLSSYQLSLLQRAYAIYNATPQNPASHQAVALSHLSKHPIQKQNTFNGACAQSSTLENRTLPFPKAMERMKITTSFSSPPLLHSSLPPMHFKQRQRLALLYYSFKASKNLKHPNTFEQWSYLDWIIKLINAFCNLNCFWWMLSNSGNASNVIDGLCVDWVNAIQAQKCPLFNSTPFLHPRRTITCMGHPCFQNAIKETLT